MFGDTMNSAVKFSLLNVSSTKFTSNRVEFLSEYSGTAGGLMKDITFVEHLWKVLENFPGTNLL